MNSTLPFLGAHARAIVAATLTILIASACRSGDTARHWWFQNRYDDSRPSALNPAEHP